MNDQLKFYADKLAYEIDSWDLHVAIKAEERLTIIDMRSPEAFQAAHIPGAINIPHRTISAISVSHVDRSSLVVSYCDGIGCNASTQGAMKMLELGFKVKELIGGLDWWKRDGHAVNSESRSENAGQCGCG